MPNGAVMTDWLRVGLLGLAVVNLALTAYHWRLSRRMRRHAALTAERLEDVGRLLDEVRRVHGPIAGVATNGHRPDVEAEL